LPGRGFNEAAALLPRKMHAGEVTPLAAIVASMRPRHYCRGRFHAMRSAVPSISVGFNEAAALLPRKRPAGKPVNRQDWRDHLQALLEPLVRDPQTVSVRPVYDVQDQQSLNALHTRERSPGFSRHRSARAATAKDPHQRPPQMMTGCRSTAAKTLPRLFTRSSTLSAWPRSSNKT
jgi:hypothetical protein